MEIGIAVSHDHANTLGSANPLSVGMSAYGTLSTLLLPVKMARDQRRYGSGRVDRDRDHRRLGGLGHCDAQGIVPRHQHIAAQSLATWR